MVRERAVLFRIKHFKKGTCRVSGIGDREFVDLVENENRVFYSCPFYTLDDPPGKGPDIGPPVSADLCFISYSPEACLLYTSDAADE